MNLKILLSGATGVIGRTVRGLAAADESVEIVGEASRDEFFDAGASADVIIDFSHPELCGKSLEFAVEHGIPMVIGTTGLDADDERRIDEAAGTIAVCRAANFSLGVNLLMRLVADAARALDEGEFDIELIETHHRRKIDAPSGTALALGRELAAARGRNFDECAVFDRSGDRKGRNTGEIGYQALRGGDVPGEHTVMFLGDAERLELTHRAADRTIFARGALVAARRLVGRKPGRVEFAELVLGE